MQVGSPMERTPHALAHRVDRRARLAAAGAAQRISSTRARHDQVGPDRIRLGRLGRVDPRAGLLAYEPPALSQRLLLLLSERGLLLVRPGWPVSHRLEGR